MRDPWPAHHGSRITHHGSRMNKSDLIAEAAKRTGLSRRDAARGVDAALDLIKRELGNASVVHIRGLGRLHSKPKRHGFAPSPIPAGSSVRLKATRRAVARLNAGPLTLNDDEKYGGNMDRKHETETTSRESEGAALGLDIGTSRLVLASGPADRVKAKAELNAFITVPYSTFTDNILKHNKVPSQFNG